jgi:molybdopterin biosynthesis enzyme
VGTLVARRGDVLNPSRIGALAAVGCTGVQVYERPLVAILSTGDEIVEAGQPLALGQFESVLEAEVNAVHRVHDVGAVFVGLLMGEGFVGDDLVALFEGKTLAG